MKWFILVLLILCSISSVAAKSVQVTVYFNYYEEIQEPSIHELYEEKTTTLFESPQAIMKKIIPFGLVGVAVLISILILLKR